MIHAADGNIPSDMATGDPEQIDEERRLFYVALTRAKDWLHICCPLRYYVHPRSFSDVHGYAQPTRFMSSRVRQTTEMITAVQSNQATTTDGGSNQEGQGRDTSLTAVEIRQRLKASF